MIAYSVEAFAWLRALAPALSVFVFCSVVAMACTQALVPLMTQIYQENYARMNAGAITRAHW